MRRPVGVILAVAVGSTSIAPQALAAPSEQDQAIAKDLFDKGVRLMEDAKCDEKPTDLAKCKEARDDFKRAYEITGALGALRNLAYTEKGLGLVASAARDFREVARRAPLDPKPERHVWADFARKEVEALDPRIPHLTIKLPERVPNTKITLDGNALPEAAWGTAIDVDPGEHSVHAEAPGRLPFEATVRLAEKQNKSVSVDLVVDTKPVEKAPSKVPPLVVGAVGLVGVGVGLGLGYASMKKRDSSCDAQKLCDPQGLDSGRSLANASTVVTGIGAALLVGGIVWYALTPSGNKDEAKTGTTVTPWASQTGGGLAAFGRF